MSDVAPLRTVARQRRLDELRPQLTDHRRDQPDELPTDAGEAGLRCHGGLRIVEFAGVGALSDRVGAVEVNEEVRRQSAAAPSAE
ncbi:hypothetical protein GCM10009560_41050 [Nonomuraea longicatena]|uniref:Uncharacterized protein n=1 Tax=Nonomuraea longicatena TaxID=83682 RepID=A0ABP4AEY9_9ACTN